MIVCDERNPKAVALRSGLLSRLGAEWQPPAGVALVLGGDGYLLRTVAQYGYQHAWLGLNAGHLGFLLNDASDLERVVSALADGRYRTYAFPTVAAQIVLSDGTPIEERAINDVYLERMTGQAGRMRLWIDGHEVVETLVSDGLIFATALGSTAYAYSAGGQPFHPLLSMLQVTPICPHQPRLPSLALPPSSVAEVEVLQYGWRPVRAVADGRAVDGVRRVKVSLTPEGVRLVYFDHHDFTVRMLRKIANAGGTGG
ncbi:MAG: NAD(+)/NADH kinase [Myxococcota bacterium]